MSFVRPREQSSTATTPGSRRTRDSCRLVTLRWRVRRHLRRAEAVQMTFVSCVMPTADRQQSVPGAISMLRAVIPDEESTSVVSLVAVGTTDGGGPKPNGTGSSMEASSGGELAEESLLRLHLHLKSAAGKSRNTGTSRKGGATVLRKSREKPDPSPTLI